ncbi:MAG: ABC transporter ATP-binding protein/permease [Oscillospiraceae bacterium]|nr:ABC transporter ATP-binding protein/permease [Oscillospiraceae bacterium]
MFLFRWLWKNLQGYRRRYIIALIMLLVAQILLIFNPFIMRIVVDTFISSDNAAENLQNRRDFLLLLVGLTIIVNLIRTGLRYSLDMLLETCSQGAVYRIRAHLFRSMQSQSADFYDLYRTGDIMTRLSGDIEMVRHTTAWSFKTMFESIVCFVAVSVFYFSINPYMALCMLAITPLILVFSTMFHKKVGPLYGDLRERLSELNTAAEENISGNRVVKAFAAEDYEITRFRETNRGYASQSKNTAIAWWKFFLPMETTSQAILAVHLVAGGLFAVSGVITMGDYMAFSMLSWALSMPMSMLGYVISDLKRFSASANKIIEVYYSHSKIVDRVDSVNLKKKISGELEFRNVSFGYHSEKGKPVLTDISFKVKAGQTVAIMGETGSGKTTLVNLIPRVYDVTKGEILVDGHNIRLLKLSDLRGSIGIATQEVLLFSDTIENNIAFGVDGDLWEKQPDLVSETVRDCAKMSDAHEFIEKTSDGYNTIVGERGVGLSGGQKQRIALARALAVKPSILILDDTTSAVDSETEKHIQESLRGLDCTKIIIAARISSVKDADCIIVLQNGKITETGTHEELIEKNGYYKEVYDLQS